MSEIFRELDERLRDIEIENRGTKETLVNLASGVQDIKRMMTTLIVDYNKVAELSAKVSVVERIEIRIDNLEKKHDFLNTSFLSVQTQHTICQANKDKQEGFMDNLNDRLTKIENAVTDLAASRNRVSSVAWSWAEKLGALVIGAILLTTLMHVNSESIRASLQTNNANIVAVDKTTTNTSARLIDVEGKIRRIEENTDGRQ